MSLEDNTTQLADGRTLGYARYGLPSGTPVFYFTGGNSSRLEGRWFDEAARDLNVDLIVPDRPGFGLSDFQPNRSLLDWPGDVGQLADTLGLNQFALLGLSGGGPHVAATLAHIPERVMQTAIVSGVAPPEMKDRNQDMWPPVRLNFLAARYVPWASRLFLSRMSGFYADPEQLRARMLQSLPQPDQELIEARPDIIETFSAAASEAHRNGVDGDAWEWQLYVRSWGFRLSEISPEIALWYGRYDRNAPLAMGQYLAGELPNNEFHVVEDGGHFSTINNHIGEIFEYLTEPADS